MRLLAPDLVKEFVREFHVELERNRAAVKAELEARDRKVAGIDRKIGSILIAIEDGMYHPTLKEKMAQLETDRAALTATAADNRARNVDVLVHPNVPDLYQRKVSELEQLLEADAEGDEARELIRSMIDKVVLTPREGADGLNATLYGELGAILAVCAMATQSPRLGSEDLSQLSVVAGARNQLPLHSCFFSRLPAFPNCIPRRSLRASKQGLHLSRSEAAWTMVDVVQSSTTRPQMAAPDDRAHGRVLLR
jgi:hypothetical protein